MLTKRQQLVKEGIQDVFNDDRINIVHLSGPPGIGKTFLVKKYLDEIINSYEDWKGYHIEGSKGDIDAYSTIIHSETSNRINENTGTNFNLGFSIPLVFSVGLTSAFKRKEIFDSKIDFFLRQLRKSSESNIVIVADSYEYWDKHSKSFIEAVISRKHLLKGKNIRLVIVTNEEDRAKVTDISFKNFLTSGKHYKLIAPEINELTEIISLLGYKLSLSRSELDTIMSLSGANIDFINMVVDGLYNDQQAKLYPDEKGFSIKEILEYRLRIFGNKEKDVNDILKASSVIDGDFNTDEVSYLCDEKYETEDLLSQSCTYLLLKKGKQFVFSNTLIQSFFYDKATETQSKFHYKYYKYLKQNRSESYSLRALHLSSANKEKKYTKEIVGLFALAYCRSIAISWIPDDQISIKQTLNDIIQSDIELSPLIKDLDYLFKACNQYLAQNYQQANNELQNISDSGSLLLRAEVLRMQLLVSLMLNMNTNHVRKYVKLLSYLLEELEIEEPEQWAQCSFALFSTYTNKLGEFDKGEEMAFKLLNFIDKQGNRPFFNYMRNIMYRKSFLFRSALMSKRNILDSVEYFEAADDYVQYYFSLCNYGGILIVLNELDEAMLHLERCLQLVAEHDYIEFPSIGKIHNNLFLARFLSKLRPAKINKNLTQEMIEQSIIDFESKISYTPSEKDAIMLINIANLHLINKDYTRFEDILVSLKTQILINNEDQFYDYYLTNLELVKSLLQHDWLLAEKLLTELKNKLPEFHKKNIRKMKNRIIALEKTITAQIMLEPLLLDQWIYDHSEHEDDACQFYCRLFLFSDLQFSSL